MKINWDVNLQKLEQLKEAIHAHYENWKISKDELNSLWIMILNMKKVYFDNQDQ